MNVRSLAYRTDLFIARLGGSEIVDRGDHLVVRTPHNPSYRWGNFLLFDRAPREGDVARWPAAFAAEVGVPPRVPHLTFAWDDPSGAAGDAAAFRAAGFTVLESVTLSAREVRRARYNDALVVRPLESGADWAAALDLKVACRDDAEDPSGYAVFAARRLEQYRRMSADGHGFMFGAFLGEHLVASCGLFVDGGLARFQSVETHPDFRRRAAASTLVHDVARYGLDRMNAERLVMVADENYFAWRIYESVGFERTERHTALEHPGGHRVSLAP